ncbi:type I-E CRISPR-associated protein Cas5/CasD [Streptomyces bacillaris]|uniref:type I-E CRISPR-associated protein Cas5/CasD n=1 Tax=unclassified Streptomyces TaxID=2593676 RepID=UPI000373D198|nr:type I-E CRISPR-associated protein Cas5/CasD [Streptomyces sp. CcalMP-8W]MYT35004.1 type I-E CRISPR-associated protein Cas5/CasD [Streptomyces sp. SID8356]
MTSTLILCLDAPMQSWGVSSRFDRRDTAREPTKSGIVGLLASALGVARADDDRVRELATLSMGVRVDREGELERDFHTVSNVPNTEGGAGATVVSERFYLSGALFLVVLEGADEEVRGLYRALRRPRWPLFLGRKAFPPGTPVVHPDESRAVRDGHVDEVLESHPWLETRPARLRRARERLDAGTPLHLRTVRDTVPMFVGAELRHDHPISFSARRRHGTRAVRVGHVPLTAPMLPRQPAATSKSEQVGTA